MARVAAALAIVMAVTACGSVASQGPASSARASPALSNVGYSPGTTPPANTGQIAGNVSYPAGVLPAQTVYAIATDNSRFYTVETVFGQRTFKMLGVAPGGYFVLSVAPNYVEVNQVASSGRTGTGYRFQAGYTTAVQCGLSNACNDHTLLPVHVTARATTTGIDPVDWYLGPNTPYPIIPPSGAPAARPGVPDSATLVQPPAPFQDPKQAAEYFAVAWTAGRNVSSGAACPFNVACVWITGKHDGQSAAYFIVQAGSNGITQTCAIYLVRTASGWQAQGYGSGKVVCTAEGTPFPTVGASGQVVMGPGETGCVNIHSAPNLSAKVLNCFAAGTAVTIDDGPVFVPTTSQRQIDYSEATDYWWHIAGRGWMVQAYLLPRHYG